MDEVRPVKVDMDGVVVELKVTAGGEEIAAREHVSAEELAGLVDPAARVDRAVIAVSNRVMGAFRAAVERQRAVDAIRDQRRSTRGDHGEG